MLYEFAITPDVFDGSRILRAPEPKVIIWMLQGLFENGLIANLHDSLWERHALQRLAQQCPPGVRDKILVCLKTLKDRKRFIPYPRHQPNDPTDDTEWLDLALDEHRRNPFHAIVLGKDLLAACTPGEPCCVDLDEILDTASWQERPQTVAVTKNQASYRSQLTPLLRNTRMLRIIDPYMVASKPMCMQTIELCADLLGRGSHEVVQRRIQIHTDPTKEPSGLSAVDQLNTWESVLRPIVACYGHSFEVFLWSTRTPDYRFHDRFLLTDQCGVGSQDSFECVNRNPSTTHWFLLPQDIRQRLIAELRPQTSHYDFMNNRQVV